MSFFTIYYLDENEKSFEHETIQAEDYDAAIKYAESQLEIYEASGYEIEKES